MAKLAPNIFSVIRHECFLFLNWISDRPS